MICNKDHCVFISICSIFARYFELSDVWDSGKSGQAARLAVYRGNPARLFLKAPESPEGTHRSLNPGGRCLWSLQLAQPHSGGGWLEDAQFLHTHDTGSLMEKLFFPGLVCLCIRLPPSKMLKLFTKKNVSLSRFCRTKKLHWWGRRQKCFGGDVVSHLGRHTRIHPCMKHCNVSTTGCVIKQNPSKFP